MTGIRNTDVKDFFQKSCQSTPSHLTVTAPSGHAAPVREGPFHLNPQSLRDSPFLPPRRGTCRRPQACSLIGIRCNLNFVYNHAAPRHSPSRFVLCSRLAVYFNELNSSNSRIYKTKISVIPLNPMQFGMFPEYADTKMPREDHRQFPRGIP